VADDFDVTGTLAHNKASVTLEDLQKAALEHRPDLQVAHTGVKLANDTVSLAYGNRARDVTWSGDYTNQNGGTNGVGRYRSNFRFTTAIRVRSRGARRRCANRWKRNRRRR
jgi:outer membrane protein TolC